MKQIVSKPAIERLTDKECEALRLVYHRLTSKQIAEKLGIIPQSVDKRLDSARIKLGAPTRSDAARLWAEHHYGERFPGPPLSVGDLLSNDDPVSAETPNDHQRPLGARLDPKRIGPLGRTFIIFVGAAVMLAILLVALAASQELFTLLESVLGPPNEPVS